MTAFVRLALASIPLWPALGAVLLGVRLLFGPPPRERVVARASIACVGASTLATLVVAGAWLLRGRAPFVASLATWFEADGHAFHWSVLVDGLALAMALLTDAIALIVARFSTRYLHREAGFARFFLLLMMFVSGMHVLVLAGSYDVLFIGWESVGIASVLLIAFFQHRAAPVGGAMRAMITYRITDVGLLTAGVLLYAYGGSSEFAEAFGVGAWPHAAAHVPPSYATIIALVLLISVMGKSALFPLGGWLPRAMEGPTPSSALFYGALSVHAGVYLVLRSAPLFEESAVASAALVVLGGVTAVHATLVGRTQADVKSALAYSTITQVGLMLVASGLHLWTWVVMHMFGHAALRLFQLLRSPSALADAREIRAALSAHPTPRPSLWIRFLPDAWLTGLYHLALQHFLIDEVVQRGVVIPVMKLAALGDRAERGWLGALSGWTRRGVVKPPSRVAARESRS